MNKNNKQTKSQVIERLIELGVKDISRDGKYCIKGTYKGVSFLADPADMLAEIEQLTAVITSQ